jgi:hypothetical protein
VNHLSPAEALETVGMLVDSWCERRSFKPLGLVLQAYPLSSSLTDGWASLLAALENVRSVAREELSEHEKEQIGACIVALQQVVYR